MDDIGAVLGTAAGAAVLGAFLAWERTLSGPAVATTVGLVLCAVVTVCCVAIAVICILYEKGVGTGRPAERMPPGPHKKG